jgi:SNF2 family DNA or RNA helicase
VVQEGLRSVEGTSDTFQRQGLVLQLILALKQVCNHPAHYLKTGSVEASLSGKGARLVELVNEIHTSGEKLLVFTQFREMGERLCDWLAEHGRRPSFLHGGVGRAQRDAMVERFQSDRTERALVLSLKAGGTGLNLTAASQVIHYDLWWNPAVEAQATDRAYRIGQQRKVQVHRLITRSTFEERINAMMVGKRELAELTVGSGEQWIGKLPVEELRELFALTPG